MDNLNSSIIIGVFSGLLTSAVLRVLKSLWDHNIKPGYENAIYKDAKIEGKWIGRFVDEYEEDFEPDAEDDDDKPNRYGLELERVGHAISGVLIGLDGGDAGRVFEVKGSFRNLIISGTFESKNKQCIERGCLNLMLKGNGLRMEGYLTNYEDNDHEVFASKILFCRNNS